MLADMAGKGSFENEVSAKPKQLSAQAAIEAQLIALRS